MIVAVIAHVVVIGALIWERTTYLQGAVGGEGLPGGGGGGGQQLRYVALPPAAASQATEPPRAPPPVAEAPLPVPQALKLPEPARLEITPITITPATVTVVGSGSGPGTGGGPGGETGSGGGTGPTTGTGTGSQDGPGSGGDGGVLFPPDPIGILIPPSCAEGKVAVHFSVEATGRVSRVVLDPWPKEAACRREFVEKMRQYTFKPAHTRDGQVVASVYTGWVIAH